MFLKFPVHTILTLACSAVVVFAGGDYWGVDEGGTTMKFLSMPVSPRSAALAGAGVATPSGFSEVTRNPLATTSSNEPTLGVNQIVFSDVIDANLTSIYFGQPFQYFNVSAGLEYLGYADLEGRDDEGFVTDDYGAMAWAAQLGIGSVPSIFNWAFTARVAAQTIENESALAFLMDAGSSFKVNRYITFGAVISNLGWVSEYEESRESAPLGLQAGVSGKIPCTSIFDLALHTDVYRRADYDPEWRFGSELLYRNTLALRAGYSLRSETKSGVSGGLGLVFGSIQLGYAYSARPAVEGNHHFNLGIHF
jgi:hypothetical protein